MLLLTSSIHAEAKNAVVLTFDDAVRSHLTFVAPLLKEHGFNATFFISQRWMEDSDHFLTWEEVAKIHEMGFEIGNHSWTHMGFSTPKSAARLHGELALVDYELNRVGIPKPISFAWTGNAFGPEAVEVLRSLGYRFARRGMQPEIPYGEKSIGPLYDPAKHHPLLIPTTADAYPEWDLEHFKNVISKHEDGKLIVLQFHGVPDPVHPWVDTDPELFKQCMAYLKENDFDVIALRDLENDLPNPLPDDPMLAVRYPAVADEELPWPEEALATRIDMDFWLETMRRHGYSLEEMALTAQWPKQKMKQLLEAAPPLRTQSDRAFVLPYPGGRHPRIGFLDGAIYPLRGTKASFFLPWDRESYVVLDLPEAVWHQHGLLYLAHTHIPTIWDAQNKHIENSDWRRLANGVLENRWTLPNGVEIFVKITPNETGASLLLELFNGSDETLSNLKVQNCVMLKAAKGFSEQDNLKKRFEHPFAVVSNEDKTRWIYTAWENCDRAWGNADCPCMHSDPKFADCAPGERAQLSGIIGFYEGDAIDAALESAIRQLR